MTPVSAQTGLGEAAVGVLRTGDARAKAKAAREIAALWRQDALSPACDCPPDERPARPDKPELRAPSDMPKRGRGGSLAKRIALLHALAHIELNAIDLAFDMIARFGDGMPREFLDDWVGVGDDEARHFQMLADRLEALDSHYGALPAHDGLWQSAMQTAHDLAARLAVVPMVLEARGLDVTPGMIEKLKSMGDDESANCLKVIYEDEIADVAAGHRWFCWLCAQHQTPPETAFQTLVRWHFKGRVKPPFNTAGRNKAGLKSAFYAPLSADSL